MTDLNTIQSLYFIGAGGIGMSNLVRYFLSEGKSVAGYDKVETALTQQLTAEGAPIHYTDDVCLVPESCRDKAHTLVVYTPAVPAEHSELAFFRQNGFTVMKRAQVLGEITRTKRGLCVAGTHGKTTTSSMIAHLLKQSSLDCTAFLGGILKNYDNNLILLDKSKYVKDREKYSEDQIKYFEDREKYFEDQIKFCEDQIKYWEDRGKYSEDQIKCFEDREKYFEDQTKYWEDQINFSEDQIKYWEDQIKSLEDREKHSEDPIKSSENPNDLTVIEADEYDRSFHWLTPYMAVITSVAPDHLDIYGTEEAYRQAFIHFTSLIRAGGALLLEHSVDIVPELQANVRLFRYGSAQSDFYAQNIRIGNGEIWFDFVTPDGLVPDIQLGVPVEINIVNAVAALAMARLNGVSDEELRRGMASFRGVKRRFDMYLNTDKVVLIDDYAHHPEELEASLSSVRKLYPHRKLTVVFQPHLYSRTQDFYPAFAQSLSLADEVILLPIYPARETPIPGVSSEMILEKVTAPKKRLVAYNELINSLSRAEVDVLLMAGAGDIELLVEPVKQKLHD
jgi:UDP-N-acetylmuramate-alanine ligase